MTNIENLTTKAYKVIEEVNKVILGKDKEVMEVFTSFLAGGHILLEDIPGVGKTTLAVAYSKAMKLDCNRVQFTPDVMPSDLTGFSIYRRDKEKFVYQQGSVFCNLLLADEINRTSPKTQSALLEVMEEKKVSVDGVTRTLPSPFIVIATQNPAGGAGTQFLPESQVDRFMISITLGYPDFDNELLMAMEVGEDSRTDNVNPVISSEELLEMQHAIHKVYLKDTIYKYLVEMVTAARIHHYIEKGLSPRATIALVKMAKAAAWLDGRDFVIPDDIKEQFPYVAAHRITINKAAEMASLTKESIINEIVKSIDAPPMGETSK